MAHQAEAYPGFRSMKRLRVFLLPPAFVPAYNLSDPARVYKSTGEISLGFYSRNEVVCHAECGVVFPPLRQTLSPVVLLLLVVAITTPKGTVTLIMLQLNFTLVPPVSTT